MPAVLLDGHTWLVNELSHDGMGSPFDGCCGRYHGNMDCDSVVDCAARWSLMASGLCYGGLPVMVGWVASLVAIADSTTTELQNTLIRLFMPVCIVLCSVFCVFVLNMPCHDD